jgi:demethylmenaquinone methyltransferase/2-methoxy-6-polyprenyl-1,4-benzoquinol methylase
MKGPSTLVDYYAQRAAEYERIYRKPERQDELRQLEELVRTALAERDVLEVACGTGYWTAVAATTAGRITALDVNQAVLDIACHKPIEPGKVSFQIGDAYRLPVLTHVCDAALVAFWWSHVPRERLTEFLSGLRQALRPGAVVVFIDNTFVPGNSTALSRTDANSNTYQQRSLDNGQTFEVLKNYPADEELRDATRGWLSTVQLKRLTYYWCLTGEISRTANCESRS